MSRRFALTAVKELLAHKKTLAVYYRNKIKMAKTENEISRILVEVRENI